jgi:hypothetical protein
MDRSAEMVFHALDLSYRITDNQDLTLLKRGVTILQFVTRANDATKLYATQKSGSKLDPAYLYSVYMYCVN